MGSANPADQQISEVMDVFYCYMLCKNDPKCNHMNLYVELNLCWLFYVDYKPDGRPTGIIVVMSQCGADPVPAIGAK